MILKCISSFFENFGFYLNAIALKRESVEETEGPKGSSQNVRTAPRRASSEATEGTKGSNPKVRTTLRRKSARKPKGYKGTTPEFWEQNT